MTQRIALVTGATDGIGTVTAIELARRGYRVILHGRSEPRIAAARQAVEKAVRGAETESARADLASLAEVRALGAELAARHDKLHVLLLNAGVFMNERRRSVDGFEMTFAVNHLAHFALTRALLPSVRAASADGHARVVTVSSIAHSRGVIDWDDLELGARFDGYDRYAQSKLANVLFSNELARRLEGTGITSNSLHPGVIGTKLLREGFGATGAPLETGARTSVYCADAAELAGVTGEYFSDARRAVAAPAARDLAAAAELWKRSEALAPA